MNKWQKVKLGDICDILDSYRVPITAKNREVGIYPYYGANGIQDYVKDFIFDGDYVLVAEDGGYFGSKTKPISYKVSGKFWVNNHAHILKAKKDIFTDYLCYSTMFYDVSSLVNGATRQKLTQAALKEIKIPLPPMEEQKKIAARLDAVSDLLAKQKQLLSEQDNLIQSTFYDMFLKQNFSKRKIVDFVETDVKNAKKIFNKNNFIKYIDISSIDNNSNIITGYTHIEFCDAPSRAQQVVKKNDILVSTVRPNLKNIALIKFDDNNLVASSGFCVLRAKNIEPVFLLYNVLSQDFTEKMVSAVTGANYPAIKNSDILNYKIPVPPLELQEKFAAIVEQIESEKSKIKSAIAETQTLFNALMSEYFEE